MHKAKAPLCASAALWFHWCSDASRKVAVLDFLTANLLALAPALVFDAALGYPAWLFRMIGHPVTWIGGAIGWLDRGLNRESAGEAARRLAGCVALAIVVGAAVAVATTIMLWVRTLPWGWLVEAAIGSTLIAQRSLHAHVGDVARALDAGGLSAGRIAVAQIVGRNPDALDEPGVCRAAIESLAENLSDGVVAPALWFALLGLPGIVAYKAINTADSMIGHKSPRHRAFGWAAARLDDLVNLPASRLSAGFLVVVSALVSFADAAGAARAVRRDARRHRSPNAGWPEAAMAGALGLRIAGPRVYGPTRVDDAWMGDGTPDATPNDVRKGLALFRLACVLQASLVVAIAFVLVAFAD